MRVDVFHNILWSKYKGVVFSELHKLAVEVGVDVRFVQIAETEADRLGLSGVDMSYHHYPHKLLFSGAYDKVTTWQLIRALFSEVVNSDADLLILPGYHRPEYWVMLLGCIIKNKKRAVFCDSTAYDRPSSKLKRIAKRIFFRFCDGFFCYGLRSRQYLVGLGANEKFIYHRCQAAALPHDYDQTNVVQTRVDNAASEPDVRFLYAGRLSDEKCIDVLIHGHKKLLRKFPRAKLVIVGSGPLQGSLLELANELEVSQSIDFAGGMNIKDLAKQYSMATCFVLPSRSEPWGLVVNESLSYGCPVIVSNVCGCVPELVLDGVTGYVFKVNDVDELSLRMEQVVENFSDVGNVAKRCVDVISKFNPANAAKQILEGSLLILENKVCD